MKKKRISIICAISIGILASINIYLGVSEKSLSQITLGSIEVLAQNEGTDADDMVLAYNGDTMCYSCISRKNSTCSVSSQCCLSWGNCP